MPCKATLVQLAVPFLAAKPMQLITAYWQYSSVSNLHVLGAGLYVLMSDRRRSKLLVMACSCPRA